MNDFIQRTILSKYTLFLKFISPVCIIFFIILFGRSWSRSEFVLDLPKFILFLLFFGVFIFVLFYNLRLKRVTILSDSLFVSNHISEIKFPYSEISLVTEAFWNNIHPVTIHLKTPTKFGNKVVFMPSFRLFGFWKSHPIVKELNDLGSN